MLLKERIRKAFEEIDNSQHSLFCDSEALEEKTFAEILSMPIFKEIGIYVIWGCIAANRPLYVGKTERGFFRALDHWKGHGHSPICEIIKQSAPDNLTWKIFFCPVINKEGLLHLDGALLSFERKIAKKLEPWFWHYGFKNGNDMPWYIAEWLDEQ